ncbi:MAG: hypothetical protein QE493_00705 [Verrucomicrobiae bacterium]|nr:hypothetical protein [Verrucomicrobiae bacterium]
MDTASASNCSSGSMYSYSRRQTSSLDLPHQPLLPSHHDQYEICGLKQLYMLHRKVIGVKKCFWD